MIPALLYVAAKNMPKPKSEHAKRLARLDKKIAEQQAAKKAIEESQAAQRKADADQMKNWLELVNNMDLMNKKNKSKERPAPSLERLKAMAKRFHMAITSTDPLEGIYIQLLLSLIDNLDPESREKFNQILGDLGKDKHE